MWKIKIGRPRLTRVDLQYIRLASTVRIIEVGPRDGLQNIPNQVPTPIKIELIERLAAAGLKNIEATSFVSPKWVPQMADGAEVMSKILPLAQQHQLRLPVLAPNMKGLENAAKAGTKEIVVFASCTEAFSKKNQNCTVDEALDGAQKVAESALKQGIAVRGVMSCIFSDPYSGPTDPSRVYRVAQRFLEMGCYEVGLGDTLGVGTPSETERLLDLLLMDIPAEQLAGHFHDTYGQAVANVSAAHRMGLRTFDSSVAGLGGCPYAKGAKGNLATEDIVYMFEQSGIDTGVDLAKLVEVGDWISQQLKIPNNSRAGAALVAKAKVGVAKPEIKQDQSASSAVSNARTWGTVERAEGYTVSRSKNAVKITLTRSKNGNAMTTDMVDGLTRLYHTLAHDKTVFHIILEAEGKYFCTGMDLTGSSRDNVSDYYSKIKGIFDAIDKSPQTTIAVIDGPCFGGGVGLGFACDVRLVSQKAKWTLSEIKLGVSPATISKFMIREWGIPFFREAMLSGREVLPEELSRIGAVHGIAEDSEGLNSLVDKYLDQLSRCAPQSASSCKELVRLGWADPDSERQDNFIQRLFNGMLAPGSEGEFGIAQFQKKIKNVDWGQFWQSRGAKL